MSAAHKSTFRSAAPASVMPDAPSGFGTAAFAPSGLLSPAAEGLHRSTSDVHERTRRSSRLRLQILNYHGTQAKHDPDCLHILSDAEFERQLDLISACRLNVLPAHDLTHAMQRHQGNGLAITFDDGCKSDLSNAEKLRRRGMSATFFVSSAHVGDEGYLDADDIRELVRMGMSIGSHSHRHVRMTTLTPDEALHEARESRLILESITGQKVDRFAFPGGASSRASARAVHQAGFTYGFGTDWGLNTQMPELSQGIIKRNNVIHGTDDADFLSLVKQRGTQWRQLAFHAKNLLQFGLPDPLYRQLRGLLVRR